MSFGELLTRWTIRAALALYFMALAGQLWFGPLRQLPPAHRWPRVARTLWTLACVLLIAHMAAAFHYYHHWSHSAAMVETTRQTQERIGVVFAGGIYLNYALALLWMADCAWWWRAPLSYARRPLWVGALVHGYLLFIALNGAVVFEPGATRWWSIAACILLLALAARRLMFNQGAKVAA